MLAWSDGDVMDEWTLTKPEGWEPNPQEQQRWMGTFQADPPGDFVDSVGVNQGIVDEVRLAAECWAGGFLSYDQFVRDGPLLLSEFRQKCMDQNGSSARQT